GKTARLRCGEVPARGRLQVPEQSPTPKSGYARHAFNSRIEGGACFSKSACRASIAEPPNSRHFPQRRCFRHVPPKRQIRPERKGLPCQSDLSSELSAISSAGAGFLPGLCGR